MKPAIGRMVSVCFSACLLLALPVVAANRAGDADNNKVVANMADAVRTQDGLLGTVPPTQVSPLALVGGDSNVGIDDVMLIAQRATASRAVIEPQLGVVSIVPPSSSSFAHLSPPALRDFQVVSSSASAQMVDGLDALSFLIAEGPAVESTLSFPSSVVAGGLASVTLNPNNPALPDDTVTTQLFFTIRNSSGTLRETVFDEVIDTVTAPFCGDSVVNPGETCDDGPGGICFDDCTGSTFCGDGIAFGIEVCDDGALNGTCSFCNAACTGPFNVCGDGAMACGEACDDGNVVSGDGCSATCALEAVCGDSIVGPGETCDDGNTNNLDGCEGNCQLICGAASGASRAVLDIGNGTCYLGFISGMDYNTAQSNCVTNSGYLAIIDSAVENAFAFQVFQVDSWIGFNDIATEGLFANVLGGPMVYTNWAGGQPDDAGGNEDCAHFWPGAVWNDGFCGAGIGSVCEIPPPGGCGDGLLQLGEFCDSGISNGTCGNCNATCTGMFVPACGDTVVECGEACDDGALNGTCGFCNAACTAPFNTCGDGSALCGEVCDDGPGGACFDDCTGSNVCGDGITFGGEACDDGALNGTCGFCNAACTAPFNTCGDGSALCGEVCDDGPGGACFDDCSALNVCGDMIVFGGETCDDGANGDPCDGCTDACTTTASLCGNTVIECAETCDDGNLVNGDGCSSTCQIGCTNTVVFEDDFSDGNDAGWTHFAFQGTDLWHVSPNDNAPGGTLPANVLWFVDEGLGSYEYGQLMVAQMRGPAIPLPTLQPGESLTYSYWENYNTEPGFDLCQGGIWDSVYTAYPVAYNSGDSGGWVQRTYDLALAGLAGQTIEPFFEFNTGDDLFNGYPGWKVDEVLVVACLMCGNGNVDPGEACDDGPGGACLDDCSGFNNCGNGALDGGEACDDGPLNGTCGFCNMTCTGPYAPTCGDMVAECGEACDDGDTSECTVGCNAACTGPGTGSTCGNTVVECAEECDDGNLANGDGCDATCQDEICYLQVAVLNSGSDPSYFTGANNNTWSAVQSVLNADPLGRFTVTIVTDLQPATIAPFDVIFIPDNSPADADVASMDAWFQAGKTIVTIDSATCYAAYSGFMWGATAGTNGIGATWDYTSGGDDQLVTSADPIMAGYTIGQILPARPGDAELFTGSYDTATTTLSVRNSDVTRAYAAYRDVPGRGRIVVLGPMDYAAFPGSLDSLVREAAANTPGACGPYCGDGTVDVGETCDDGPGGTCFDDCSALNVCGDSIVFGGETCDDGAANGTCGFCNATCTAPFNTCGDGAVACGEVCDDGDTDSCTAACNATCTGPGITPVCGDTVVECAEQCDDGNLVNGDGCSDVCASEIPTATFPFVETWESGVFDGWWTVTGTGTYRTQINNAFGPSPEGVLHLTMDSSSDGTYARNELTLRINLAGQPVVVLDFYHQGTGDEPEAMPPTFVGGSDSEGVAVSVDGTNWCRVTDLSPRGSAPWAFLEFDLVAAMTGCAMVPSSPTFLRFQQYDNFQAGTDGHFFDRIRLYAPVCGDGLVATGESCDDGALNGTCGFCDATCSGPFNVCGDGNVACGEACDDGDTDTCTPACNNICTGPAGAPVCGNGVQDCGEQCDDGNLVSGDGCQATCLLPVCGDGVTDPTGVASGATLEWVSTACGLADIEIDVNGVPLFDLQMGGSGCDCNSFVQSNSAPLPAGLAAILNGANNITLRTNPPASGNLLAWALLTVTSGSGPQTLVVFSGGNPGGALARDPFLCNFAYTDNLNTTAPHNVSMAESCDDGANNGTCGFCNATCSGAYVPVCGNGTAECAEACDDGFTDACGTCDATCTGPGTGATCGDGAACPELEACDDGFTTACGPCNDTCTGPGTGATCGDAVICTDTEICDDGGNSPACDANCTPAACGDGYVNPAVPETCDDGNVVGGDGCEATCQLICGAALGAVTATQDPVNGNCYLGYTNGLDWPSSQAACESIGGHLATITSAGENALVRTAAPFGTDSWLGINDFGVEAGNPSLFVHVTGGYLTFLNWNGGEPNGGPAENCVQFAGSTPLWNDLNCGAGLTRVCELEGCGDTVATPPESCDDGANTPVTLGSFPDANSLEIAARGNFSYTADIGAGLLNIVDFTNPVVPVPVGFYPLPNINSVELAGKRAYLGADFNGVAVIDTSLCAGPCPGAVMGNFFTPGMVFHVSVAPGGRAFVSEAGPALIEELNILGPVPVPAGPPLGLPDNAYESVPVGNVLYVSALGAGLQVIDITTPGTMIPMGGAAVQGATTSLAVQGTLAYVGGGSGLSIFDVTTCIPPAPCAPPLVGAFSSLTGSRVEHVTVRGKRAYLSSGPEGLVVLDITNPVSPVLIGRVDTPGGATDVALAGMRAYESDQTSTRVFNISEDLLCTDMCAAIQVCGDGMVTGSEVCDDANTLDCDGCRGDCSAIETGCGDGFLCAGEVCDDGVGNGLSQNCNAACTGIAP